MTVTVPPSGGGKRISRKLSATHAATPGSRASEGTGTDAGTDTDAGTGAGTDTDAGTDADADAVPRGALAEAEEVEAARGVTAEVESFAGGISGVRPAGRPAQARAKSAVTAVEADRARRRVVYVRRTRG